MVCLHDTIARGGIHTTKEKKSETASSSSVKHHNNVGPSWVEPGDKAKEPSLMHNHMTHALMATDNVVNSRHTSC